MVKVSRQLVPTCHILLSQKEISKGKTQVIHSVKQLLERAYHEILRKRNCVCMQCFNLAENVKSHPLKVFSITGERPTKRPYHCLRRFLPELRDETKRRTSTIMSNKKPLHTPCI